MSFIGNNLHKIWGFVIEGKGFRGTAKFVWRRLWEEIDRLVAIAGRWILNKKTKVSPNKVFFHTQESKYTCNPKYICQELMRQCPDIDVVWRAPAKGDGGIPAGIRTVRFNSFDYFKELFSAKVVVTNSFLYVNQPFRLKKEQKVIQTWHGSLGIKRHDQNAIKDSKRRVEALQATGRMTSYCISNSSLETGSLRSTYWPNTPILEYGHARNDIFFPQYEEKRIRLRKMLFSRWGLDQDTKVIMYGPTFRDDKNFECYNVDFQRVVEAATKRFGGKWCVLLRYHPSLSQVYKNHTNLIPDTDFPIINVTDHEDMQELISVTDLAITDYSSWIYDFVLMRKPGFIFATDIKKYNTERGFYYPLEETPFPIAVNNDQMVENILAFDEEKYLVEVEQFLKDKGCIEDGHASERVVKLIEEIIRG